MSTMRGFFVLLFLFASIFHVVLAARGNPSTAEEEHRFEIERYPSYERQDYVRRFREHVHNDLGLTQVRLGSVRDAPVTSDQLASHLILDKHQRRLIYLGHTEPQLSDMVIASPLSGGTSDGSKLFSIFSAHKNPQRAGHAKLKAYGFVKVENPGPLMQHMDNARGTQGLALEKGNVLKLGEMLDELPMLFPPGWNGRPPRR
ncbi:uncharacterized protein PSANT_05776 [Moesziomyces antarcticus]|nr:uncharacterized protein PSANT_05776 [Moesziomyces antarcticus]